MKAEDMKNWTIKAKEGTALRHTRARRAARQQQTVQPEQEPALQAPIPVVLRVRGGAIRRPRGRSKGSKNKPK